MTAAAQADRIRSVAGSGDWLEFYEGGENGDRYTARSPEDVDIRNGIFPVVRIEEFEPRLIGHTALAYRVTLEVRWYE